MKLTAYLSPSRHGIYYFRWPLPPCENGKRHTLRLSLKTRCPNEAGRLARYLSAHGNLLKGQALLGKMRYNEIRALVSDYFADALARYVKNLHANGITSDKIYELKEELREHENRWRWNEWVASDWITEKPFQDELCKQQGVSPKDWNDNSDTFKSEARKARIALLKAFLAEVEKVNTYDLGNQTFPIETQAQIAIASH